MKGYSVSNYIGNNTTFDITIKFPKLSQDNLQTLSDSLAAARDTSGVLVDYVPIMAKPAGLERKAAVPLTFESENIADGKPGSTAHFTFKVSKNLKASDVIKTMMANINEITPATITKFSFTAPPSIEENRMYEKVVQNSAYENPQAGKTIDAGDASFAAYVNKAHKSGVTYEKGENRT